MPKKTHMEIAPNRRDHDRFHRAAPGLTPRQHATLMKKMGITTEQDEEWHRTHLTLAQERALKPIDPYALGGGFLAWCVQHGWLVHKGRRYFASREGLRELRNQFEISL